LFLQACQRQCALLARAGQWDDSAQLAERWLDASALSAEAAVALVTALAAPKTGEADRRALNAYQRLTTRLAREFGSAPETRVRMLAEEIAARRPERGGAEAEPDRLEPEPITADEMPAASPPPTGRRRRHLAPVAAALLLLLITTAALLGKGWKQPSPAASASAVAVLPFQVRGGPGVQYLRQGMVDLLSTNLDGAGALRTVDPRAVLASTERTDGQSLAPARAQAIARRFGAGLYVLGEVVAAGDGRRMCGALYDQRQSGTPLAQAVVEGTPAELFALVDRLTVQLLAAHSRGSAAPVVRG